MPLDLVSFGIGLTSGVLAASIAWSLTQRRVKNPEATKLTATWALAEVARRGPPAVMTERLEGLDLPRHSKVLVADASVLPVGVARACDVRVHPDARMNYVLGRDAGLVFSGHMHPRAHVVFTREESAVRNLQAEFTRLWAAAEPWVERVPLEAVPSCEGRHVEITGTAGELMEFRGRRMLRVTEGHTNVGVVTDEPHVAEMMGKVVRVVGRVASESGQIFLEARRLERVSPQQVAAMNG